MVEPLLHFAIPFALLTSLGLKPKRAFFISLFALLPDIDVLLSIHRFYSHSIVLLLILSLLLLPISVKFNFTRIFTLIILTYASHIFLDIFTGYTPVLWPLYNQNIWITLGLMVHITSPPACAFELSINLTPTVFERFSSLDAAVFTGTGLATAILLIIPVYIKLAVERCKK